MRWVIVLSCGVAATEWLTAPEGERTPPTPEVYALRDAPVYARWEREGVSRLERPKWLAAKSPLERLQWEQWHNHNCHNVAHAIGREMYAGDLDAAISACEYRCTGGCVHGVVGAFVNASRDGEAIAALLADAHDEDGASAALSAAAAASSLETEAVRLLWRACFEGALARLVGVGECAHAVGHALALVNPQPSPATSSKPKGAAAVTVGTSSLAMCEASLQQTGVAFKTWSMSHYCCGGVIMQHGDIFWFGPEAPKTSKERTLAVVQRCADRSLPAIARGACFAYGLMRRDWHQALAAVPLCRAEARRATPRTARTGGREDDAPLLAACAYGAAAAAMYHGEKPSSVARGVQFCESFERASLARVACVDGFIFRQAKYGSPEGIRRACANFTAAADADLCDAFGEAGMYSMRTEPLRERISAGPS